MDLYTDAWSFFVILTNNDLSQSMITFGGREVRHRDDTIAGHVAKLDIDIHYYLLEYVAKIISEKTHRIGNRECNWAEDDGRYISILIRERKQDHSMKITVKLVYNEYRQCYLFLVRPFMCYKKDLEKWNKFPRRCYKVNEIASVISDVYTKMVTFCNMRKPSHSIQ